MQDVIIDRDPEGIDRWFAPDYIQHNPDFPNGSGPLFDLVKNEYTVDVGLVIAQGDYFIIHNRINGLGTAFGLDADASVILCGIYRIEQGLVRERWDLWQEEVPASETVSGNSMQTLPNSGLGAMLTSSS